MNKFLAVLLLSLSLPALAALDVGGVKFEDKAKVGAGETALNGAGLRGVLFIKVYAMALYLPQKAATSAEVFALKGAKRIHIVTLREVSAEDFTEALVSGIRKNHSDAEIVPLNARIEAFKATMLAIGTAAKGATIQLDWLPDGGGGVTRLTLNGQTKGEDMAGEDFYRALLKIWLGDKPVSGDLKEHLLGKPAS